MTFSIKGDSVIRIAWSEVSKAMTRPSVMELNNGELECEYGFQAQRGISRRDRNSNAAIVNYFYFSKIKTTQVELLYTKSAYVNVKVAKKKLLKKVLVIEKNYSSN